MLENNIVDEYELLYEAASSGELQRVRDLIARGVNVNPKSIEVNNDSG